MEDKKITILLSPTLARVFQRLLTQEINNQETWKEEEQIEFGETNHQVRDEIIDECESLRNNLEEQGYEKYYKY